MSNHHVTLETAQRLKAAGFPQTTLFRIRIFDGFIIQNARTNERTVLKWCAAPILTEVLEQLWNRYMVNVPDGIDILCADNPAEAAALLWLKLKEDDEV